MHRDEDVFIDARWETEFFLVMKLVLNGTVLNILLVDAKRTKMVESRNMVGDIVEKVKYGFIIANCLKNVKKKYRLLFWNADMHDYDIILPNTISVILMYNLIEYNYVEIVVPYLIVRYHQIKNKI